MKLLEPRSEAAFWYCERCSARQEQPRLIYGVSLCFLCIPFAAEDPQKAHHLPAKVYVLEQAVKRLVRINTNLRGRLERMEGAPS